MNETRKIIGTNLREVRKARELSADKLAALLSSRIETEISGDSILAYETGKRPVTTDMLIQIADVLDCSIQALLDGADPRLGTVSKASHEIAALSPADHNIIRDIAANWDGDVHALIVAMGIYCALPPHRRREAMLELLTQLDAALASGDVKQTDLPPGIDDLEKQTGGLFDE